MIIDTVITSVQEGGRHTLSVQIEVSKVTLATDTCEAMGFGEDDIKHEDALAFSVTMTKKKVYDLLRAFYSVS
ncbi:MAG: hypothetical protein Q4P66_09885 [Actinomycetaceae bacterium]|nr:hypothetical protein [Actinomycetaceae bacterium]